MQQATVSLYCLSPYRVHVETPYCKLMLNINLYQCLNKLTHILVLSYISVGDVYGERSPAFKLAHPIIMGQYIGNQLSSIEPSLGSACS